MNLLGRKKDNAHSSDASNADVSDDTAEAADADTESGGPTAPKGRPTPKRGQKRRPVPVAPMTTSEARKRRKELGRSNLTREEKKAERVTRRADATERREKMMAGEDAYLLPRDKGPVHRYIRDVVDTRRNVLGLFMPSALALIFVMLAIPSVQVQAILSPAMLVLVLIMVIDGFVLGRKVNKLVDEKFPNNVESSWKLGFYAASRASQLRRMRAPRPQVNRGDKIT